MKIELSAYDMKSIMAERDRDYFSIEALDTINDLYGEDVEFDPVGICCDWTEYGKYGASFNFDDMIRDFKYLLDPEEDCTLDNVLNEITNRTTVFHLTNGNYLICVAF